MLKGLQNKRNAKIQQVKTLMGGEITAEVRSQIDAIKAEVADIDKDIANAKFVAELEAQEVQKEFSKEEKKADAQYNWFKALKEGEHNLTGLEKEMHDEGVKELEKLGAGYTAGVVMPQLVLKQRMQAIKADVTAANTANFTYTTQDPGLRVANTMLILPKLGIQVYDSLNGNIDVPSMSELTASFVDESSGLTVVTVTDAKATMTPRFIPAQQAFTRQFLNQTSQSLQNQVLNQFLFALDKGLEKEVFKALSGITESLASLSAITWANFITLQNYIPFSTAYVMSRQNMSTAKTTSKDTGSGRFIHENGQIDGIDAYGSTLVKASDVYLGNFGDVAVGYWGGVISITDPYGSNKNSGKVEIQLARMADAKVLNSSSFARMVIG